MSSFYKTPLRSDELYHWKYKDKYKKGDHWVYIYDDGSTSEASSAKLVTTTTNDTMNKRTTYNKVVSTNPKQLFTTRSKDTIGFKSSRDRSVPGGWSKYSDEKRVADFTTTTEKVTYGRLHMERMNLERKISEIPEQSIKTVKGLISRFTHKKDDTPEGAKKAIDKYKQAKRKTQIETIKQKAADLLKNKNSGPATPNTNATKRNDEVNKIRSARAQEQQKLDEVNRRRSQSEQNRYDEQHRQHVSETLRSRGTELSRKRRRRR